MHRHMQKRHEAHVGESNDEQHQEGNRRIILIHESIRHDERKICAEAQFEQRHNAGTPLILLGDPPVLFTLNMIFRRTFKSAFDAQ